MTLPAWLRSPLPDVAVAIDRGHVSAARVEWRGGRPTVAAHAIEALPPGAVTPALAAANMPDVGAVGQVVARVLGEVGRRASRVALVVPDPVAKVSLVRLETVPARAADLREIIRWQVRKSAPFPVEQAALSICEGMTPADGGREFVVTLAREDVVRQYEQACAMAGAHAGLVDVATFGLLNSVLTGGVPEGDWLLVHVAESYLTLAVARSAHLIFYRHRSEESEGTLADLIHQTAMYYEDRLQGRGLARVWLAGAGSLANGDEVRQEIEGRLGVSVEPVGSRHGAALAASFDGNAASADRLAPLVGILRRQEEAA